MALYTPILPGDDGYRSGVANFSYGTTNVVLTPGAYRVGMLFSNIPLRTNFSQAVIRVSGNAAAAGFLRAYVACGNPFGQPEAAPTPFSDSRLPGALPYELLLGTASVPAGALSNYPLAYNTPSALNAELTFPLTAYLRHALFTGSVPVELEWTADSGGDLTLTFAEGGSPPQLDTGTELPFLTGLDGEEYARGQSRVDECPVTGKRNLREQWVQNRWNRTLCDPSGADPEDYQEKYVHYERPPLNDAG